MQLKQQSWPLNLGVTVTSDETVTFAHSAVQH